MLGKLSRCGVAVWRLQLLQDLRHPLVPPCWQVPAALRDLLTARHQVQQHTVLNVATHMTCVIAVTVGPYSNAHVACLLYTAGQREGYSTVPMGCYLCKVYRLQLAGTWAGSIIRVSANDRTISAPVQ
jgi:hypothetical protein